jgi:cytoskeletal protein CcmA (bactofilin family)
MRKNRRRIRDSASGPKTYIGEGSKIRGEIKGQGAYVFCGEFEGDCDIDGLVTLTDSGKWTGTMKGTDVVIAGEVQGDIVATQRVEIAGSARVRGSLSGHSIAVAEGAVIEGELKVTSGDKPTHFQEKRTSIGDAGGDS